MEDFQISFPTEDDKKAITEMSDYDLRKINLILIQASKIVIYNEEETTELAQKVHAYYLLTHAELEQRIPEYPKGDGFEEYLAERAEREEIGDFRLTGKQCPNCGSSDIHSKGKERRCGSCGKRFSKHF